MVESIQYGPSREGGRVITCVSKRDVRGEQAAAAISGGQGAQALPDVKGRREQPPPARCDPLHGGLRAGGAEGTAIPRLASDRSEREAEQKGPEEGERSAHFDSADKVQRQASRSGFLMADLASATKGFELEPGSDRGLFPNRRVVFRPFPSEPSKGTAYPGSLCVPGGHSWAHDLPRYVAQELYGVDRR